MKKNLFPVLLIVVFGGLEWNNVNVQAEVLTPPYFNLAEGRRITATSTCGQDIHGPELYCKLVGATSGSEINTNLIQGQFCDYCDSQIVGKSHPAQHAIDGSERWWQSPPLSRGMKYNEVNLTIDLGQEFHVAYVFITMANSPRPGIWVLERSRDNGETYKPWQYFAETPGDCENFFGKDSLQQITRDDSVVCDTSYSRVVPLEGGEIVVSLLNNRPSSTDFFESEVLQEWTRATNIRMRFIRTKTLLGHLMSVARQDPTVTRRYFYSIKDISIGGRCRCNGHADLCDITDPEDVYKLLCRCQHQTCGTQCDTCCPGFVQKAWRPATNSAPFVCEQCNCFHHSNECYYDAEVDRNQSSIDIHGFYEGGGVCENCRDNTEGINCHKCRAGYYRPFGKLLNATDVCHPCQCDSFSTGNCAENTGKCECMAKYLPPDCDECNTGYYDYPECKPCDCHHNGTRGAVCHVGGGQCPCKQNFASKNCDRCADGFYKFPECLPCACDPQGSNDQVCEVDDGQCDCGNKFGGRQCSTCEDGYFNFPTCTYCNCDVRGTKEGICDKGNGVCICREGYGGPRCDQCLKSYYGYPECRSCNCSTVGSSAASTCDATGKCPCLPNFSGRDCSQCRAGYYQYPDCFACNCFTDGSMGEACDDEGRCQCKPNFDAIRCDQCREGFYNVPLCEECNCDPSGVVDTFITCGNTGELCQCKERVQGRICNECRPLFWNLQHYNPKGCEDCNCFVPGIIGGVQVCEGKTGQCPCKNHVMTRKCEQCQDSYYNLTAENLLGCTDCNCDVGGAVNNICDKQNGDCNCQPRVIGKTCTQPLPTHYFPTLYQFQYEAEDGVTKSGGPVRFSYDESVFPEYSWRGYAVYSQLQPETIHDVYIEKSSLYRVVFRYLNRGEEAIVGEITAIPENPSDVEQKYKVKFEPKKQFVTVSTGNVPSPFVLNPGRWHFSIKTHLYLLIDYFTLLPGAYYEGSILQKRVTEPCYVAESTESKQQGPCLKLNYPSTEKFDTVLGVNSYIDNNGDKEQPTRHYSVPNLDIEPPKELVLLTPEQDTLNFEMGVTKSGRYALILDYFTPADLPTTDISLEATSKKGKANGQARIYKCQHTTPCRQVILNEKGEVTIFRFDQNDVNIILKANISDEGEIAVHSITAIPIGRWSLDYIRPKAYCIFKDGSCVESSFNIPPDSTKVEAETSNSNLIADDENMPPGVSDRKLIKFGNDNKVVEIPGKVSNPGYYKFLIHYNQPENPDFTVDVIIQNGQHYEARVPVSHCPSIPGCRALVSQEDKNARFYVDDDFVLTFKSPKSIWIDYILAVPAPYENRNEFGKFLEETPLDETRRFIAECGKNHMFLPRNTEGFCRDAVFSLTTDYNNGALPCQCDFVGSKSFECEQFGGQCQCRDNVIGRRCERCRTGYFGFPNCKPCECPSTALCDPLTGACICPSRVIGEKCDTCEPLTYGFDAVIGCVDCACSTLGVTNNNIQCDLSNGSCTCQPNVVGRTCSGCSAGYWAFPYCQLCDCDVRGTTADICNQESAQCYCKFNVEGRGCENCKVGSFNLEERNPSGCTKCFCFSKTSRCSSSVLFWTQITADKNQWTALAVDPHRIGESEVIGFEVQFEDISAEDGQFIPLFVHEDNMPEGNETNVLYFKANLMSNFLSSYGGKLTYSLNSDPLEVVDREIFTGPDVILEGRELAPSTKSIRLMHFAIAHLDGDHNMKMSLRLTEDNFMVAGVTGGLIPATRDQLMVLLKGLASIYIRATYWKKTREARLNAFSLEVGTEEYSPDEAALSVEQCQCPPNYQGLSCEECAKGYYRSTSGPFGGYCSPCQCHGHSASCDPVSGVCLDCRHNTTGDHCDKCHQGYHGDATQGTPYDCLICACPLPIPSNNFATSCEFSSNGLEISCECKENYWGPRCESCGPGFHGNPEVPGDVCKPCECSGNIDVNDPSSCDSVTGACLQCMNNTGGAACNLCARGYFGDALLSKDCRSCNCNECGTMECDSVTGDCYCLNNVVGQKCDKCAPNHFGFSECDRTGCHYCDCGIAARSTQCDDFGNCNCKPGTAKPRCDRCAQGFWNFTEEGCVPCECNSDYAIGMGCDPETGQCSCLPGVVGEKCDSCPYRWVLLEERGCMECTSCQHQLLDETDRMMAILGPVKDEFDSVAVSYFTTQKLAYFNSTAAMLEPDVKLLDPSKEDVKPFYESLEKLGLDAKTLKQKTDVTSESLKEKAKTSVKLKDLGAQVESKVQEAVGKARTAVFETKDLMEGLLAEDKLTSPQTEAALTEAKGTIESMRNVVFNEDDAISERDNASQVLKEIKEFIQPVQEISLKVDMEADNIMKIKDKLKDIRNQSSYSVDTSLKAADISKQIKDARFPTKIAILEGRTQEMTYNVDNATDLNYKTPDIVDEMADKSFPDLEKVHQSVSGLKDDLIQMNETLAKELVDNKDTIALSNQHARKLKDQADDLDDMFGDSESVSGSAFAAATSYQKITDAINEASKKAQEAKQNAENTTQMTNGIGDIAATAVEPSRNLVILASQSQSQVQNDLKIPLDDSKGYIKHIDDLTRRTNATVNSIAGDLDKADVFSDPSDIRASIATSTEASEKAQNILETVEAVILKLPNDESLSRQLPITVTDLNKAVEVSDNQLRQARESIPLSSAIAEGLTQKKPDFDRKRNKIAESMENLKAQIKSAREQANRVQVGMNIMDSSTLVLANPQSLDTQQVRTQLSIYFKTREPNGLILFLGNEPGRKPESDFMAIEVDRGYPSLTVDLGSGPQQFVVKDKYVADDIWYKATVDRIGRRVHFTVTEETSTGDQLNHFTDDYYRLGTKSLLNVDRNSSKLYVGGFPPGHRNPVKYSNYNGQVEDLTIGDEKVGLWNFKDSQNLAPAYGRDRFLNLKKEKGLRFLGNGYAIMERKFGGPLVQKSSIRLKFQTRAKNGLLFLAGKGKKFMSLEIVSGFVVFQFNLGGGVVSMVTPEVYNDGRWHTLQAVRAMDAGNLKIDNVFRGQNKSTSGSVFLAVSDYLYFGGYPGQHDYPAVTQKDFEGCIDDITLDLDVNVDQQIDLTQAIDTRDTMVGCPASQVEQHVATFYGGGYAKVSTADSPIDGPVISQPGDELFELNFRFRSNSSEGLIFYGSDPKQENYISVSLLNGALVIKTEPGEVKVSSDALNDAIWHVVTVTRDKNNLRVNVDDAYDVSEHAPDGPLSLTAPGSILLFGGRPDDFEMPSGAAASTNPYTGCLADININGRKIDLTDADSRDSSISQKCQVGEREEPESIQRLTIPTTDDDGDNLGPEIMMQTTTKRPTLTPKPTPPPQPRLVDESDFDDIFEEEDKPETTTMKPKKITDPEPTPFKGCKLPLRTKLPITDDISLSDGIRFGNFDKASRLEYQEATDDPSGSEYSIDFKTSENDGIILMKTNVDTTDFIALYILGGSVHFAFDSGAGMALLNTTVLYHDDTWHSVTIKRVLARGELHIDGFPVATGDSPGTTTMINAGSTLYVGGLSQPIWGKKFNTGKKIKYIDSPFKGCLKHLYIKSKNPGQPSLKHSIEPCTENGERGFFFYPNKGFLRPVDRFMAGRRIKLSLSIKPRTPSGILLSVHGKKDYMVLQMLNGTVKFTVDNGKGVVSSSFTKEPYDLCDGKWHTIQVSKSKNVVTLSVDNIFAGAGIGPGGTEATDTQHPLYFGGHPSTEGKLGLETREQFVGCMKDLTIETQSSNPAPIYSYSTMTGTVGLHTCPID